QAAEAAELLAGPADAPETILVGDINSDADTEGETYETFLAGGFTDAWTELRPSDPGFTWGFDPLTDPGATLSQRLDVVLYRGDFVPESISLVGDQPAGRTPSGLWPSDHAGVVATLSLPSR
ncbi:MAG TPA: endonuclease/exonuclease/phosphatase family protein, partial [Thermoanaerobaculia bacterium]|nr:endonuclease/exonuclease/phosphatase family protein [Thermoanaerobaculia bacterium]